MSAAARVEIGTFVFQGREFTALGSVVDHEHGQVIGYPSTGFMPELRTWDGRVLGGLKITGYAQGFHGVRLTCYRARIDGIEYVGRGLGAGMLLRLRRAKGGRP